MSTYFEIIERVDERKPNAFSEKAKLGWLTALDGRIAADIFLMGIEEVRALPRSYPEAMDKEPLVGYPHDDLYDAYLEAKIDYANGDFSSYQNCMEAYNQLYSGFRLWFANTYDPVHGCRRDFPGYYITAYGLAVKAGFNGTLESWLESLHGPKGDPGKSAYEYAVEAGYQESEAHFYDLLMRDSKSAYQYAKEGGYEGTEADFAAKLAAEWASKDHNHDENYAPKNHDHAETYASKNHNHDENYAPKDHNHDATYAKSSQLSNYLSKGGGTMTGQVTLKGVILTEGKDYGTVPPENPVTGQVFCLDADVADEMGL